MTYSIQRGQLITLVGPDACATCLNRKDTRLHHELCVTGAED